MRRLIITLISAATLAAGLTVAPVAAVAGDHRYERNDHRGYWERPGDRRRWNRHNHRRYRDRGVHYYPGYGYYEGSNHRGHRADRGNARSRWCASQYRSYDWRTGTFVGYDGIRRYCG